MIGRRDKTRGVTSDEPKRKSFDDFEFKLGDMMRGERATLGKSLLDVQRDLKIKATYIAAIENADIEAFDTKGFIAGYVRSYARYLGIDPEWAYDAFCREADVASGIQTEGLVPKAPRPAAARPSSPAAKAADSPFGNNSLFVPQSESWTSRIEPGAIGSTLVMGVLISALGYGGWAVLREVQQVRVTPVESAPGVLAELDPVAPTAGGADAFSGQTAGTSSEALNRLYRPQALDVPVMTPRDGPIAALDPFSVGVLSAPQADTLPRIGQDGTANIDPGLARAVAEVQAAESEETPLRVLSDNAPEVMLVAINEAWVRVRDADGSVLLERILQPGDSYVLPRSERPATLRAGASGNVFFMVNGETYGPAGSTGAVVSNVALSADSLTERYARVDPDAGAQSAEAVRVAEAALEQTLDQLSD